MDFLDSRKQFDIPDIELDPRAHGSEDRHSRTRRPVHFESQLDQVLDHLLYQRLFGAFLHGNNHKKLSAFSSQLSVNPAR